MLLHFSFVVVTCTLHRSSYPGILAKGKKAFGPVASSFGLVSAGGFDSSGLLGKESGGPTVAFR